MAVVSKIEVWNLTLDLVGENVPVQLEEDRRPAVTACKRHFDTVLDIVLEEHAWPFAMRQRKLTQINSQSVPYNGDGARVNFPIPFAYLDNDQVTVVLIAVGGAETTLVAGTNYTLFPSANSNPAYIVMTVAPAVGQSIRITVTKEVTGWEYIYALPPDCVRPIALLPEGAKLQSLRMEERIPFELMADDAGYGKLLVTDADNGADDFERLLYVARITDPRAWPQTFVDAVAARLALPVALALKKDKGEMRELEGRYVRALDIAITSAIGMQAPPPPAESSSLASRR